MRCLSKPANDRQTDEEKAGGSGIGGPAAGRSNGDGQHFRVPWTWALALSEARSKCVCITVRCLRRAPVRKLTGTPKQTRQPRELFAPLWQPKFDHILLTKILQQCRVLKSACG